MRFYRIAPSGPDPILPPDELSGEVPIRAYRFCEPFLAANRAGWLLNPPTDFELLWTGREFLVKFDTIESWIKVDKLFLPEFADYWHDKAPAAALDMMPPFLEAFPERGVIQAWSGFLLETDPDVSTWIRGPINRNAPAAYHVIEAIVETDWWMGPLFTNFQFVKTDDPVRFESSRPWLQLVEVPREVHLPRRGEHPTIVAIEGMSDATWSKFMETSDRRNSGRPGSYRLASKRMNSSESTVG
jgi:hypothetical protein